MTIFSRVLAGCAGLIALAALVGAGSTARTIGEPTGATTDPPGTIVASFAQRSYPQAAVAHLDVRTDARRVTLQLFRAGPEAVHSRSDDQMKGVPVGPAHSVRPGRVAVRLWFWPSGMYFAQLTAPGSRRGYAPFVLRPLVPGLNRVAVVLPTNTWAAYNLRDTDGDGVGNSWYASPSVHEVDLSRPFLNHGVPPRYRGYDAGYLRWLAHTNRAADYLCDEDLDRIASGKELAARYDLLVFPGHEEYVTEHVYNIVERYRNLGGNLMFLSANNFFYKVVREGHVLHGRWRWRDLHRPEAALVGAQYVDWDRHLYPNRPYVVVGARIAPWLFRGTGLRNGRTARHALRNRDRRQDAAVATGDQVLAIIRNIFGPGKTAEMTYYETRRGAKVFDAGTINFGSAAASAPLLNNLWARLSRP